MRKLRNSRGFTLTEMLACVLILLLIAGLSSTVLHMAVRSYNQSLFQSESQYLENMLNVTLSDVLRYARDIDETAQTFTQDGMTVLKLELDVDKQMLQLTSPSTSRLLLNEKAYAESLYLTDFDWTFNDGVFTGAYTIKSHVLGDAERRCAFAFRSISDI